jgi:hypothetical protein
LQIPMGTIVATFVGLVAAGIVWSVLAGNPLFGSDRAALIALVVAGFGMCVGSGVGNAAGAAAPTGPMAFFAGAAGVLTLVILGAVVFGWTAILDPLAGVVYGTGASSVADKVGVITVGALIAIAWLAATLRQVGIFSAAAG